jgi:hypothetical protein
LTPNRNHKKLYPKIVKSIEKYTEYCDENGDNENIEWKKITGI